MHGDKMTKEEMDKITKLIDSNDFLLGIITKIASILDEV